MEVFDYDVNTYNKQITCTCGLNIAVGDFFKNYGWYTLVACIGLIYIYSKLQPYIERYLKQKEEAEYAAMYHKSKFYFR